MYTRAHTCALTFMCLQGNYTLAAEELIVHTYFFCGSRDVLPKVPTQQRTKI